MADIHDDVRIILSLPRLGELIAAIALRLTEIRDIEPPDFDGPEMRDLAVFGWNQCVLMSDREQFAASVLGDIDKIATQDSVTPQSVTPQHRPEFGFFDPPL